MLEHSEPTEKEMLEIAEDIMDEHSTALSLLSGESRPGYKDDTYPDWDGNTTYVVSGPIGKALFRGTRYNTWQEAKRETHNRFPNPGQLVQFWTCGPRWFARVRRPSHQD